MLRVLVLHNTYRFRGGEDVVVQNELDLLIRKGHIVKCHILSNQGISTFWYKALVAIGALFSFSSYLSVKKIIDEFSPDIVHVHNFFPMLSPSIFYACRSKRVPVVLTLHNYRILCPTGLLMHEGKPNERSLAEGPWWALRHRVYQRSWIGTFVLCLMISLHHKLGTWRRLVDVFVTFTNFGRIRFEAGGIPADRIIVKPNFANSGVLSDEAVRKGILYVGRLSSEKGVVTMLDAMRAPSGESLRSSLELIGDGPLAGLVTERGVKWLGQLTPDEVRSHMQAAQALLIPSICYEGFPMVLVEAYACGLPVIASRIGALAELVEDGVTGLLFEPGDTEQLANSVSWALCHPDQMRVMGQSARKYYEENYTPERNYERLMSIYHSAIVHCRATI